MRMSQAIASESPAPAAGPRIIAMVGLGISCSQREVSMRERSACARSSIVWPPSSLPSAMALTSPPAQKPRPAPVSTTTPTAGSSASRGRASSSASSIGRDIAFSRSGRLSVSTATPSFTCSIRSVLIVGLLRRRRRIVVRNRKRGRVIVQ